MSNPASIFRVVCGGECEAAGPCQYRGWTGEAVAESREDVRLRFPGGAEAVFYWSQVEEQI